MFRRPPISTRTHTPFPVTRLFRSGHSALRTPHSALGGRLNACVLLQRLEVRRRDAAVTADQVFGVHPAGFEAAAQVVAFAVVAARSEEHTSELQSLMRISYAVCCLKQQMPAPS